MLVFIGCLSLSTLRWVPMCQGFSHFSAFLHHFIMATVAATSIRDKDNWDVLFFSTQWVPCSIIYWTSLSASTLPRWTARISEPTSHGYDKRISYLLNTETQRSPCRGSWSLWNNRYVTWAETNDKLPVFLGTWHPVYTELTNLEDWSS